MKLAWRWPAAWLAAGACLGAQAQPVEPEVADPFGNTVDDSAPKTLRLTLAHEGSAHTQRGHDIVNNRSAFRVEYSKFLQDGFYVQLDSKLNAYWHDDHRARAEGRNVLFETSTPEAFVQYSAEGGRTSLKAGIQRLIWGESEAGAITDVVSPRNLSELFFIPLEESRIGQFMLTADHFSDAGNWTAFVVPQAKFNKYPEPGTAYYIDALNGMAALHDDPDSPSRHEAGMRWKQTFNGSDVSLMLASVVDNDHVFRLDGAVADGRPLLSETSRRYTLAGMTFNHTRGKFLFKGELGYKAGRSFNDTGFQIRKRDVVDASLGATYALAGSDTLNVELVNSHVTDWSEDLVGVQRNTSSVVLNATFFFLNDRLSVNWLTIATHPYTAWQTSLRSAYKWSDNLTLSLDAHAIRARDPQSGLYRYRDQGQVFLRAQYQF